MTTAEIDTETSIAAPYAHFLDAAQCYAPYYLEKLSIIVQQWFNLLTLPAPTTSFGRDHEEFLRRFSSLEANRSEINTDFNMINDVIELQANGKIYSFLTRIIESKAEDGKENLRLVLWSSLGNLEASDQDKSNKSPWTPLCKEERAAAPLEVLKHYTSQFGEFSSILTSSMGTSFFDGLTLLQDKDYALIPKTLIISRGMPSAEKYLIKKHPWIGKILATIASYLGLAMDGEKALITFLKDSYSKAPSLASRKTVVLIEMSEDTLFSEEGAFDADFGEKIEKHADLFRGSFTLPMEPRSVHHYASLDRIKKYPGLEGCQTEDFLEMEDLESIPEALSKQIFSQIDQTDWHTSLLVGGRGTTLDKMTVNYAIPILQAFLTVKKNKEKDGYND